MLLWSVIGTKFSLASWCVDSLGDDTRSISLLNIDSSWVSVSRFPLQFAIMFLKLSIKNSSPVFTRDKMTSTLFIKSKAFIYMHACRLSPSHYLHKKVSFFLCDNDKQRREALLTEKVCV